MSESNSSVGSTPFFDRLWEWVSLARMSRGDAGHYDLADLDRSYQQHNDYALAYLGRPLPACRVVEVGYGARPNRLLWFFGHGVDVTGIDLDQPVLYGRLSEFWGVLLRNGWERALKSFGRWWLNERGLRRALLAQLSQRAGRRIELPAERLEVGDASAPEFWQRQTGVDYIFSEDVLEHIPEAAVEALVAQMASSLAEGGIAVVKPMVFTGICGGHHLEWYPHTLEQTMERRTEPWEHLRQNRHPANTYLNQMPLAAYRAVLGRHFEILEETVVAPDLGKAWMTPEIRDELKAYPDEELFSNGVVFVLRRPGTSRGPGKA